MEKRALSVYIHIPFCVRKCNYCDFLSSSVDPSLREEYVRNLCEEIQEFGEKYGDQYHVISVFLGGGTPSILSPGQIGHVIDRLRNSFSLDTDCEITMECNPGTVDRIALKQFFMAGINRLSIGLQSTNDDELLRLGRIHTYKQFLETYEAALRVGFTNLNVDLMSAIPGQSLASYKKTLKNVLMLKPQHISVYSLILEEGTPLFNDHEAGVDLMLPTEEEERAMYALTEEMLANSGYHRYEISNYAKDGFECRHNKVYWERGEYVGFGIGASSLLRLTEFETSDGFHDARLKNDSNLAEYAKLHHRWTRSDIGFEDIEKLSKKDCMEEYMFLGLRMMQGVSKSEFRLQFGKQMENVYGEVLRKYISTGHLIEEDDCIRLSAKGIDVSNVILADFLTDEELS